ncbi:MAG TPA: BON domain-containing protein [Burkholderiaceae bacterium]|nr:BON domain-containing protein [Burkholderiaceae bacterium]
MPSMPWLPADARIVFAATALALGLGVSGCEQRAASNGAPAETAGNALDDTLITTKVKAALVTDRDAHGADTSVQTRKGQVILSGFVDSQSQKDRQSELARSVAGVQDVDNKLMLKSGPTTPGSVLDDSVVTVKVKTALLGDAQTQGSQIAVTTNKGVVQLSGFVDSTDAQARAASVARNVEGVQNVVNDTRIKQ